MASRYHPALHLVPSRPLLCPRLAQPVPSLPVQASAPRIRWLVASAPPVPMLLRVAQPDPSHGRGPLSDLGRRPSLLLPHSPRQPLFLLVVSPLGAALF